MYDAVRRIGCIAVCGKCVRSDEQVRSTSHFGDFEQCGRCKFLQLSSDKANWVLP